MPRKLDPNDIADMQVAHKIQTIVAGDGSPEEKIKKLRVLNVTFKNSAGKTYLDKDKKQVEDAIAELKEGNITKKTPKKPGLIYKNLPHLATKIKKGSGKKTRKKRRRKKKKKRRKTRRKRKKKKRKTRSRRR